jgi:hypothetical protein
VFGKEVEAFGWWFTSERFETRAKPDPLAAVRILDGVWESVRDQRTSYGWRDECRNILQTALASGSDEAKQVIRALINKLAARGLGLDQKG